MSPGDPNLKERNVERVISILENPWFLGAWLGLGVITVGVLVWDFRRNNPEIPSLMKGVWIATVVYSGSLGLAIYWGSGRKQISRDSLWRRGFRSVSHCYSGCGAGEVAGIFIAAGLLSLSTWWVAGITFSLAYVAGFAMTMGPLMQEGESFDRAFMDALYSETASITVMEIVAIGVDLWLAGESSLGDVRFWSSLVVSLTVGLVAAYPVNVLLVWMGVKEGMMDPREYGEAGA